MSYANIKELRDAQSADVQALMLHLDQRAAERAYSCTSHYPERRGMQNRIQYANECLADLTYVQEQIRGAVSRGVDIAPTTDAQVLDWYREHKKKIAELWRVYFSAHARVASSFIVGPANFPVSRNEKRSRTADARYQAIAAGRAQSIKRFLGGVLPSGDGHAIRIDDPTAQGKIDNKLAGYEATRDYMKRVNAIVRRHYPKGVARLPDAAESCQAELAAAGIDNVDLKPNYMGRVCGFEGYQLSDIGAEIRRHKARKVEIAEVQTVEIRDKFDNGVHVCISDDQKILITFGFKPSEEVRSAMKMRAFKWSRFRGAWVRKLTANARADYERHIKNVVAEATAPGP